ncbi:MAG: DUF1343 domain-containing protein [Bacteroidetes bacterium]|nr:DUF1343 domain-containing protein [Bacteroidota bacterium]
MKHISIIIFCLIWLNLNAQLKTGAERTGAYFLLLQHKEIAVVANPTSLIGNVHLVDSLVHAKIKVSVIFSPEHGFRKFSEAGQPIGNSIDSATGIPVISLYGKKKKPLPIDLNDIDLVLFDLQDVGVRFYTYLSTLSYIMEACAEKNIPMILLDRPNPNGFYIDGPVMEEQFASFAGLHPVPVVYGLTIGEYAQMINGEGWLQKGVICDLQVIPLENYNHQSRYLLPAKPSPNLGTMNAVYLYPSLCFFEGTQVSVGRGTPTPFEVFGHPAMKGFAFSFMPESVKGSTINPPCKDKLCLGLDLSNFYLTHPRMFGRINLSWLIMAFKDLGSQPDFFNEYFDKLAGNSSLRTQILQGLPESEIRKTWEPGIIKFKEIRKKYLIYDE